MGSLSVAFGYKSGLRLQPQSVTANFAITFQLAKRDSACCSLDCFTNWLEPIKHLCLMILLLLWETADYAGIFNGKKSHSITSIITKKSLVPTAIIRMFLNILGHKPEQKHRVISILKSLF